MTNSTSTTSTSASKDLHVVLGATGGSGSAVVRALVAQGKRVRAVSRSGKATVPAGVEIVKADITNSDSSIEACNGASVVYNCANVFYAEWLEQFPKIMSGGIAGAAAANAKLVFTDNLYMYGKVDGPMTETTPYHPMGKKGTLRAELAKQLIDAHERGIVRAIIARASDYYGPHALSMGSMIFEAVAQGKKASWIGKLDQPHSMTYLDNFGRGVAMLGERDESVGEIWHIPSGEALTGRQFISMVYDVAQISPKIGAIGRSMMQIGGLFLPIARESLEVLFQFEAPFIMDTSKFAKAFGDSWVIPHREAISQTLAWYHQHQAAKVA